jgi:hypothetical protein
MRAARAVTARARLVLVDHGDGPARDRVRTDGHAPTLEQAKADFRAQWEAFKSAAGNVS